MVFLQEIFPGLLLWHITLDAYKVDDFPEDGKVISYCLTNLVLMLL